MTAALTPSWSPADERRHDGVAVESWWFWGAAAGGAAAGGAVAGGAAAGGAAAGGATVGVYVGFELYADCSFDYCAGLVRAGRPYVYVEELDGRGLREGLEIKPPEMWADHVCDEPFRQWSVGNEAHGVSLDDPEEVARRAYGDPVPVTFDVEWYANADPLAIDGPAGCRGYRQDGEVDAVVELLEGPLRIRGPASRLHTWGTVLWRPAPPPTASGWGLRAPCRRRDGTIIEQLLVATTWVTWTTPSAPAGET